MVCSGLFSKVWFSVPLSRQRCTLRALPVTRYALPLPCLPVGTHIHSFPWNPVWHHHCTGAFWNLLVLYTTMVSISMSTRAVIRYATDGLVRATFWGTTCPAHGRSVSETHQLRQLIFLRMIFLSEKRASGSCRARWRVRWIRWWWRWILDGEITQCDINNTSEALFRLLITQREVENGLGVPTCHVKRGSRHYQHKLYTN